MHEGIFFINNALRVTQLSVFSEEERYEQTLRTIKSIDEHCPNNLKFMFDSSPEPSQYMENIANAGVTVYYGGADPQVQHLSYAGARSMAETMSFLMFLEWFGKQDFKAKRIYKLSGRYVLNNNFVLDDPSYKDAFVFSKRCQTWMKDWQIEKAGTDKLFRLRLWHMDYSLLDTFKKELANIMIDCMARSIDVEHSYYKNLHTYNIVELDKIGVCGHIAPSGDSIDE